MKLKLNKQAVVKGVKVAAATGAGVVAAKVGGRALRAIGAVGDFAAGGEYQHALTDLAGGGILGAAGVMAFGKFKGAGAAVAITPFVAGGVILGAFAEPVGGRIVSMLDGVADKLLPAAGLYADPREGLGGDIPPARVLLPAAGVYAEPDLGLGGDIPSAAGSYASSYA